MSHGVDEGAQIEICDDDVDEVLGDDGEDGPARRMSRLV
jgi:hypothetical protein